MYEYLAANADTLAVHSYAWPRTLLATQAGMLALHRSSDLGIELKLQASPPSGKAIGFQEGPVAKSLVAVDERGKSSALGSFSLEVKPIIWTPGNPYPNVQELRRADDILITPTRLEAAEELNATVAAMHAALIAENS